MYKIGILLTKCKDFIFPSSPSWTTSYTPVEPTTLQTS